MHQIDLSYAIAGWDPGWDDGETLKRKFGDSLRSKTDVAMANETLCKILCHNLVVLIHEAHELGIDPMFWNKSAA